MVEETDCMGTTESQTFPPTLVVGSRVWTSNGYNDHGPVDGPKIDIAPNQGGTITATQKPYFTMDDLLYSVRWDNGQESKHYYRELFSIGRFQSRVEFEQAIKPFGVAELTLGPAGGFRHARFELEYDGKHQTVEIYNRDLWIECVEALVKKAGCTISTTRLPGKSKSK
jgi:hypothetical protein